jgi:hypothetical protein
MRSAHHIDAEGDKPFSQPTLRHRTATAALVGPQIPDAASPSNSTASRRSKDEQHAGFSAEGELRRRDYGIDFGVLPIGADRLALADIVRFELDLQFVEPPVAGDV